MEIGFIGHESEGNTHQFIVRKSLAWFELNVTILMKYILDVGLLLIVGSSSQADYLERNAAMDDSIGGS